MILKRNKQFSNYLHVKSYTSICMHALPNVYTLNDNVFLLLYWPNIQIHHHAEVNEQQLDYIASYHIASYGAFILLYFYTVASYIALLKKLHEELNSNDFWNSCLKTYSYVVLTYN